jgi:hypothetical protein
MIHWHQVPIFARQALCCLVLVPLALHFGNIFPNTHFSRYSLYFWFPTAVAAAAAWRYQPRHAGIALWVITVNFLTIGALERWQRGPRRYVANAHLLRTWDATRPGAVARYSDRLCQIVQCEGAPVVIAAREVQLRLRLDQRFVVRSLDGIVDYRLASYIRNKHVDHLGYLSERKVDVVVNWFGAYGTEAQQLARIAKQALTAPVKVGCDTFRMVRANGWLYPLVMLRTTDHSCSVVKTVHRTGHVAQ